MDGFKFNIGDTLTHAGFLSEPASPGELVRLFVLERLVQECPGGAQRHYRCRVVTRNGLDSAVMREPEVFNEIELAPMPPGGHTLPELTERLRECFEQARETLERMEAARQERRLRESKDRPGRTE